MIQTQKLEEENLEKDVNKLVEDYPGAVVPEGETYNFTKFYAKRAISYGKDTQKFDAKTLEEARRLLDNEIPQDGTLGVDTLEGDGKVGANTIGTVIFLAYPA